MKRSRSLRCASRLKRKGVEHEKGIDTTGPSDDLVLIYLVERRSRCPWPQPLMRVLPEGNPASPIWWPSSRGLAVDSRRTGLGEPHISPTLMPHQPALGDGVVTTVFGSRIQRLAVRGALVRTAPSIGGQPGVGAANLGGCLPEGQLGGANSGSIAFDSAGQRRVQSQNVAPHSPSRMGAAWRQSLPQNISPLDEPLPYQRQLSRRRRH